MKKWKTHGTLPDEFIIYVKEEEENLPTQEINAIEAKA